jgi:rare lipoprotein A
MRASRLMRVPGAAKLATGALIATLPIAGAVLVSNSAVARGAQGATRATAHQISSAKTTTARKGSSKRRIHAGLVVSRFVLDHQTAFASPTGSTVVVHGLLTPSQRGAEVKLIARAGRHWRTLATSRTHRNGRFQIHYRVHGLGSTAVRVSFQGSKRVRASSAAAGQIVGLEPTVASWYYDAGNTACGFHATYGVANKTLPCGTKVTISYGGRTVVATVDDRGPYIYGRSFDLNQNTARYLGMWGVGQVFASV